MTSSEIRDKFLEYFKSKDHEIVPSSALVPKGDATLLFTNAGMVQFKGLFLEEEKRDYLRAASSQKCVRAGGKHNDLENVGQTLRHHTFFEMLGNFSFGDYFKDKAIEYGWEFLTAVMGLDPAKLWITVFTDDVEAEIIWEKSIGVAPERIVRMGEKDNFWSMGETGPCGPCSEIHIDQGVDVGCKTPECKIGCDCDRFLEIWNLVFMQYNRDEKGELTPLPKPSIDTGMGLERLTAVLQGQQSNYDTDLFVPLIELIEKLSGVKYGAALSTDVSVRAIADHARAVTFLITDGILPSNEGRGYVLRRILRRAARHGKFIGLNEPFIFKVCEKVTELMGTAYPEVERASDTVLRATRGEEERFFETLTRGLELLDLEIKKLGEKKVLSGEAAFMLYDTFGFPVDLTADILKDHGVTIDEAGFDTAMEAQRTMARSAWKGSGEAGASELYKQISASGILSEFVGYDSDRADSKVLSIIKDAAEVESAGGGDKVEIITEVTPFYGESGGQVGDSGTITGPEFSITITDTTRPTEGLIVHHGSIKEGTIKTGDEVTLAIDTDQRNRTRRNHSATHILHAALRARLGDHVRQAGSLVTPDHLRFDFNHFEGVSETDLAAIEAAANLNTIKNAEVVTESLPYDDAVKKGALAFFEDKYSGVVRMVGMGKISTELCGGTHVKRTGDIGPIKITAESSIAAGVRRIEAVTGEAAVKLLEETGATLKESARLLKTTPAGLPEKIEKLIKHQKELEREITRLKGKGKTDDAGKLIESAKSVGDIKVLSTEVEIEDGSELRELADRLREQLGSGVIVLGAKQNGKAMLLAAVTKDLTKKFNAGEIIKTLAPVIGGRGGGRADMAQAGGKDTAKLAEAVAQAYKLIEEISAE
ncbi:MAG: alanine--tRNA ligase [Thermodesulfobacteriota bacterium]